MSNSGTSIYVDPDDYQGMVREGRINLVLANAVGFKARQTWVEFSHLRLLRTEETLPRVAYVSLPPEWVFVGFPCKSGSLPTWGGMKLKSDEIVLHGCGERMHYTTSAVSRWGMSRWRPTTSPPTDGRLPDSILPCHPRVGSCDQPGEPRQNC